MGSVSRGMRADHPRKMNICSALRWEKHAYPSDNGKLRLHDADTCFGGCAQVEPLEGCFVEFVKSWSE
jgi:hypothetical protein